MPAMKMTGGGSSAAKPPVVKPPVVKPPVVKPPVVKPPVVKPPAPAVNIVPSTSSSTTSVPPQAVSITNPPMPVAPAPVVTSSPEPAAVKNPTRNVTDISSLVPQYDAEEIQRLLFENLSAVELSKIERHDTIEGINQKYSIISNLSEIRTKYDSTKQLTIMEKFKPLANIYTIKIQDYIPLEDYLLVQNLDSTYQYLDENNQIVNREKGYYYIDSNGDLIIELVNLEKNQQVEVLIDTNGTIYKVES